MSNFKYFEFPEKYAYILEEKSNCDICGEEKQCFDAENYTGLEDYYAFCFDCVATGKLEEIEVTSVEGDWHELLRQLKAANANLGEDEIEEIAQEKSLELESSTPVFATWQDWFWPAHCGDYCKLIQLAGQEDYNNLAPDGNGKELFQKSLYYDLREHTDVDAVWDGLKHGKITGIADDEDNWGTMAYIFKCLNCGEYITIWDCD